MLKAFYQEKLEELILDLKAFEELKVPKIGTSGIPLFYYIAIEKLLDDNGAWEKYGHDSKAMADHAVLCLKRPAFSELSNILSAYSDKFLSKKDLIAGYQRRDWPFSSILAYMKGRPHYSFYKNGTIKELAPDPHNNFSEKKFQIKPLQKFLFVSDLLNLGSSVTSGWWPTLKNNSANCRHVIFIFSRNQGGEKALQKFGIKSHSLIKLGAKFIERYCKNKTFCTAYWRNPIFTSTMYLRKNGALEFLPYFDPKLNLALQPRVVRFYQNWLVKTLSSAQKQTLIAAVKHNYNADLAEVLANFTNSAKPKSA